MADIHHNLVVNEAPSSVFQVISTPDALNKWWTLTCSGEPLEGAVYQLGFGPGYDWQARVSRYNPDFEFELVFTRADSDWLGTQLRFVLREDPTGTNVTFHHVGWPVENDHYRTSCYCWAMYLRLMKRLAEFGEVVPYDKRLEV